MKKIKRDTTKDLFLAVLELVKKNGHYDKAAEIMDYVLPNYSEYSTREDIELSNYRFNFEASAQFGGSEGIYIDCCLNGEYTENELKRYNHGKGILEPETKRQIGTFKTLKDDLESMKIMGELCGALIFYAHQYVNQNINRYTPAKELEAQQRYKNCHSARNRYIQNLAENMTANKITVSCEICAGKQCNGKQDGCRNGIIKFFIKETGKYCSFTRSTAEEHSKYYDFLDGKFNKTIDCFDEYVNIFMSNFPDLLVSQAVGYVFTWLYTRNQNFIYYFIPDEKNKNENGKYTKSYENLNTDEKNRAFNLVKAQLIKETIENDGDIIDITDDKVLYYAKGCVYFYENGNLTFEY